MEGAAGSKGSLRVVEAALKTTGGDCRNVMEKSLVQLFSACGLPPQFRWGDGDWQARCAAALCAGCPSRALSGVPPSSTCSHDPPSPRALLRAPGCVASAAPGLELVPALPYAHPMHRLAYGMYVIALGCSRRNSHRMQLQLWQAARAHPFRPAHRIPAHLKDWPAAQLA